MEKNINLLIALLLITTVISSAESSSLLIPDDRIDRDIVGGTTGISCIRVLGGILECPFPPPKHDDQSLPLGGNVAVTCRGKRVVVRNFATDTSKSLSLVLSTIHSSLFQPDLSRDCRIAVRFPFGGCAAFTGVLVNGLTHVSTTNIAQNLLDQQCPFIDTYKPNQVQYVKDKNY